MTVRENSEVVIIYPDTMVPVKEKVPMGIDQYTNIGNQLTAGVTTPLKNTKVSWYFDIPN